MRLYHYTIGLKVPSILTEGCIRTTPSKPVRPERAIAWLSSNSDYENTALKIGVDRAGNASVMTLPEMDQFGGGVWRVAFDVEPAAAGLLPWEPLWKASKMGFGMAQRLARRAGECSANPGDWWGSFKPIALTRETVVERMDVASRSWMEVDLAQAFLMTSNTGHRVLQATALDSGLCVPQGAFRAGARI